MTIPLPPVDQAFTVIFLLNHPQTPTHLGLLTRASWKKIAPNWRTGIGGHVEPGETALACAIRETQEEVGLTNLPLTEFAQAFIPQEKEVIHYFHANYPHPTLPLCNEGTYAWYPLAADIPTDIIGSTYHILNAWRQENWSLTTQFTINIDILNPTTKDISLTNRVPSQIQPGLITSADFRYKKNK